MSTTSLGESLNSLILDASGRKDPLDNQELIVTAEIERRDQEEQVSAYVGTRKDLLKSAVEKFNPFVKPKRQVVLGIRSDARISLSAVKAKVPHLTSRIVYEAQVEANLRTPKRTDSEAMMTCAKAFADCSLANKFDGPVGNPERSANRYLRRVIEDWLSRRLETENDLKRRNDPMWLEGLSEELRALLVEAYGLNGQVVVKLLTEELESTRISALQIDAATKDSYPAEITVTLSMDVLMADGRDLFDHPLDENSLRQTISQTTRAWVNRNVSLQAYRFEAGWKTDLKRELDRALLEHGRQAANFVAEANPANYERVALNVESEPLDYVPFGWSQSKEFEFTCSANMECVDAGRFERYRSQRNGHNHKDWLRDALKRAVETLLHGKTYTELMVQWFEPMQPGDPDFNRITEEDRRASFDEQIRSFVGAEAERIGWRIQTLLAQPDNIAIELRDGTKIVIPEDEPYQVIQKDGATVSYETTVRFAVPDLRKIRKHLDNSANIHDFYKEEIREICERTTIELSADEFYRNFKGTDDNPGFTEKLTEAIETHLDENLGAERISVLIRQSESDDVKLYKKLTSATSQKVDLVVQTRVSDLAEVEQGGDAEGFSDLPVSFWVKITGISVQPPSDEKKVPVVEEDGVIEMSVSPDGVAERSEPEQPAADGWGQFLTLNWKKETAVGMYGSELQLVMHKIKEMVPPAFKTKRFSEVRFQDDKGLKEFAVLLQNSVDLVLLREFGLSGTISSIDRGDTGIEIALRNASVEYQRAIQSDVDQLQRENDDNKRELEVHTRTRDALAKAKVEGAEAESSKFVDRLKEGDAELSELEDIEADIKQLTETEERSRSAGIASRLKGLGALRKGLPNKPEESDPASKDNSGNDDER